MVNQRNPVNRLYPQEELSIQPRDTALLVIDMQYLDAHPDWGIGRDAKERGLSDAFAYYWRQIAAIVPRIRRMQDACRARQIEVIHVRIASTTRDSRESSKGHHLRGCLAPADSQEAKFLEEVAPLPNEIVIMKITSSAFTSSGIDQTLRNLGVRNLIACGVATSSCVEMTVRDAADRNYGVLVVEDACAAATEELHRAALLTMDGFMGLVQSRSTEEIIHLLDQIALSPVHTR